MGEATDALRGALADRFRDSSDTVVGGLVSALGALNLSVAQFRHVADHPDIYGPEIVAVFNRASEENRQYIGYLANTMRYYGRNAAQDYTYGKIASAGLALGVGRLSAPSAESFAEGSFSITKQGWRGYPDGFLSHKGRSGYLRGLSMTLQGKQQTELIKRFVRQTPVRWLEKRFTKSNLSNSVAVEPTPQTKFHCQQTSIDNRSHLAGTVFYAHYKVTAGVREYDRRISAI